MIIHVCIIYIQLISQITVGHTSSLVTMEGAFLIMLGVMAIIINNDCGDDSG